MKLIRIGYRIINVEAITHVSYQTCSPLETDLSECIVSFGGDDCQIFYEAEAEAIWKAIQYYEAMTLDCPGFEERQQSYIENLVVEAA